MLRALTRAAALRPAQRLGAARAPANAALRGAARVRELSSINSADQLEKAEDSIIEEIFRRAAGPERKLRAPTPMPPTTYGESWAPSSRVSPNVDENALSFRTRFYIDASGEQPDHARKVHLVVRLARLGLSAGEERRLVAVANKGNNYDPRKRELKMSCGLHHEVARNKLELRRTLGRLVLDARENAEAHAATPDSELPLAQRARPWLPVRGPQAAKANPKVYRGRAKKWKHHSPG